MNNSGRERPILRNLGAFGRRYSLLVALAAGFISLWAMAGTAQAEPRAGCRRSPARLQEGDILTLTPGAWTDGRQRHLVE